MMSSHRVLTGSLVTAAITAIYLALTGMSAFAQIPPAPPGDAPGARTPVTPAVSQLHTTVTHASPAWTFAVVAALAIALTVAATMASQRLRTTGHPAPA